MRGISRLGKNRSASQKGLYFMEIVGCFHSERKIFPVKAKSANDKTAMISQHFRFRQLSV